MAAMPALIGINILSVDIFSFKESKGGKIYGDASRSFEAKIFVSTDVV